MKDPEQQQTGHVRRIRSFIAVNLPVPTIRKVGEVQSQLRDRAREAGLQVGWVAPTSMHLTLKFLAEIPEESVWAIRDLLRERLAGRSGFWLRVRGAGAFPDRRRPRVLWVGIESQGDALSGLAGDVEAWMEELGFAREARAFRPHLTLGRVKGGAADVIGDLEQVDLGECAVNEVVLYQSVLRRQGAEYVPLATIPLRSVAREAGTQPVEVPELPGEGDPGGEAENGSTSEDGET